MQRYLVLPLCALLALAVYKIAATIIDRRRHAAKARELKCEDAPMYPDCGFLGFKHVKLLQKADQEQLFPDMMIDRQNLMNKIHGRVCSTFKTEVMGQKQYFTSDPENVKAMLATQFEDYDLGPARRGNMIRTLGDGIFVQDGKAWEHSRAMLRPNFVREQVSDLELEEEHVQNLLNAISPPGADGWTPEIDIQTLFFRLTIDTATEFLFGESVESQINEMPGVNAAKTGRERAFATNFDSAQLHMAKGFRLADLYWLHNPKDYRENNKVVHEFVDYYVNLAIKGRLNTEKKMEDGHKKERYVFLEAVAQQTQDPYELRSQLLNILLAGRDTTASLLSWLFHELLRNPHVFEKLRSTVLETFGTYEEPRDITFPNLKGCQYLQYCLNETLRLWPIVPLNGRRSNKATTLPRGGGPDGKSPIYIPPQTDVNYGVHVTHRRTDIWGSDADEFKPERFIGRKSGWEYLPFNGGPRICIGQQLALTEASYVVVRLLQKFDKIEASAAELAGKARSNLTLTSAPGRPIKLRLHHASQ